jgi:hypothetical protein
MALLFSTVARGSSREAAPLNGASLVAVRLQMTLSTANNVTGNIIDYLILPADCHLVDAILDTDDLDSNGSPAILLDVGVMTGSPGEDLDAAGAARTIGAEIFSASTVAQAGGVVRPTLKTAFRIAPVAYDRSIGVKINTQSATAASGDIGLTLVFRSGQA